jgi:hypothetical protein
MTAVLRNISVHTHKHACHTTRCRKTGHAFPVLLVSLIMMDNQPDHSTWFWISHFHNDSANKKWSHLTDSENQLQYPRWPSHPCFFYSLLDWFSSYFTESKKVRSWLRHPPTRRPRSQRRRFQCELKLWCFFHLLDFGNHFWYFFHQQDGRTSHRHRWTKRRWSHVRCAFLRSIVFFCAMHPCFIVLFPFLSFVHHQSSCQSDSSPHRIWYFEWNWCGDGVRFQQTGDGSVLGWVRSKARRKWPQRKPGYSLQRDEVLFRLLWQSQNTTLCTCRAYRGH